MLDKIRNNKHLKRLTEIYASLCAKAEPRMEKYSAFRVKLREILARWGWNYVDDTTHTFFILCSSTCFVLLIWAAVAKLDIVSNADGEVIPSSKLKKVQHLEGGIVREIPVREGQKVVRDQPLVILEQTVSGASVEELKVRIDSLRIDVARLEAAAKGLNEPAYPPDLLKNATELVAQSRELFRVETTRQKKQLAEQASLIKQREHEISEIESRRRNSMAGLRLVEKQLAISSELLKDNLTTEYKHINFQREAQALRSKIEEDSSALSRAHEALKEAKEKLERLENSQKGETMEALKKAQQELDEFNHRMRKFSDSFKRTTIRAPVEGIVKTLYVSTLGGVVTPGMTIADVVPSSDRLIIEARLPAQDIGYVREGQAAKVKLSSRDAMIYGHIDGKVVYVAPDSVTAQEGRVYYPVRIETERDSFEKGDLKYRLFPGMLVIVNIHIGRRSVLQYVFDPLFGYVSGAMQER